MKRKFLSLLLLFIGATTLFIACEQEDWLSERGDTGSKRKSGKWHKPHWSRKDMDQSAWSEARAQYDMHKEEVESVMTRSAEGHPLFEGMVPAWKQSYTRKGKGFTSVETVLRYSMIKLFVMAECEQKFKETGDRRYLHTLTRLVILLYDDGREPDLFFMTISPSVKYQELTQFRPFYNTYPQRDKRFDGKILFHNLQGEYVNGWLYQNGKVVCQLVPMTDEQLATRAMHEYCDPVYERKCEQTDDGEDITDETGEATVTGECEDVIVGWDCVMVDDGFGDGFEEGDYDSSGGGTSGGSHSGGNKEPMTTQGMSEELLKLFQGHNIGNSIAVLNQRFREVLEKSMYKNLYNKLIAKGKFSGIIFDFNIIGCASTRISGLQIELVFASPDMINAENIEHELFHLYQIQENQLNSTEMKRVNGCMEFEQALFRDIQKYIEMKGDWEKDKLYNWACWRMHTNGNGMDGDRDGYMNWLAQLTNQGTGFPIEIGRDDFNKWMKIYPEVDTNYNGCNYPLDYNIVIINAFK